MTRYYDKPADDRHAYRQHKTLRQQADDARFIGYLMSLPFRIIWHCKFTIIWLILAFSPVTYFGILDGHATTYQWFAFWFCTGLILLIGFGLNLTPAIDDSGRFPSIPAWLVKAADYAFIGGDLRHAFGRHRRNRVNDWLRTIGAVPELDPTKYRGQMRQIKGTGFDITVESPRAIEPEAFTELVRKSRHHFACAYSTVTPQLNGTYLVKYRYADPAVALAQGRNFTLPAVEPFVVGRGETGENIALNIPADSWHTGIQGQTRSGEISRDLWPPGPSRSGVPEGSRNHWRLRPDRPAARPLGKPSR